MKKYAENVSKECVKKYLKKKKKELQSELYPKLRLERLHKVRKIFKVIIYLSSIEKYSKKKLSNFFRTAETLIGQWHDRQTLTFALMRSKTTSETKRLTTESKVNIVNLKKAIVDYYKKR